MGTIGYSEEFTNIGLCHGSFLTPRQLYLIETESSQSNLQSTYKTEDGTIAYVQKTTLITTTVQSRRCESETPGVSTCAHIMSDWPQNLLKLTLNSHICVPLGTNLSSEQKCTDNDIISSHICPIWGQSDHSGLQ